MGQSTKTAFCRTEGGACWVSRCLLRDSALRRAGALCLQKLRFYDVDANKLLTEQDMGAALLDCAFLGDLNTLAVGGLSGLVQVFDLASGQTLSLGKHEGPVRFVRHHKPSSECCSREGDGGRGRRAKRERVGCEGVLQISSSLEVGTERCEPGIRERPDKQAFVRCTERFTQWTLTTSASWLPTLSNA